MRVTYRGHEIDCYRDETMGGERLLFYSIFRVSDQREITSGFTSGSDRLDDYVGYMKQRVDGYILDPREEFPDETDEEIAVHLERLKGIPLLSTDWQGATCAVCYRASFGSRHMDGNTDHEVVTRELHR